MRVFVCRVCVVVGPSGVWLLVGVRDVCCVVIGERVAGRVGRRKRVGTGVGVVVVLTAWSLLCGGSAVVAQAGRGLHTWVGCPVDTARSYSGWWLGCGAPSVDVESFGPVVGPLWVY